MIFNVFFLLTLFLSCFASVKEMSLEEKVGQLLMVHFNGEKANEEAETLIQKIHVGGIIYYNWANGLTSPEQVRDLSASLQKLSGKIPLFIAVDQEGGLVARLNKGFTIFPGNKALGMTGEPELAQECAFAIGQEIHAAGVNFNLSPVVDVNNNPRNPVIGIRSFGDTTETVIPFAKNAIEGYNQAGIITSLKHFPGHGDVEVDSHYDLPIINKSKEQLEKLELLPFAELANKADTVMTAHVLVPSLDPINCATLSKSILDLLRKEIGFEGVIISDSLVMEGLLKNCSSIDDATIRAFNAGCDILMLGGKQLVGSNKSVELSVADVERIHHSFVQAVKKGLISEKRVDESVQRILDLKAKYNLLATAVSINPTAHQELAQKIASLALKKVENKSIPCLQESKVIIFAPALAKDNINQTSLLKLGKENSAFFFSGLSPSQEEMQAAQEIAETADILIFCSYNAWKNSSQLDLIHSLPQKPLIHISLRDPLDATLCPEADLSLTTFGPTVPSIEAAVDFMKSFQ